VVYRQIAHEGQGLIPARGPELLKCFLGWALLALGIKALRMGSIILKKQEHTVWIERLFVKNNNTNNNDKNSLRRILSVDSFRRGLQVMGRLSDDCTGPGMGFQMDLQGLFGQGPRSP